MTLDKEVVKPGSDPFIEWVAPPYEYDLIFKEAFMDFKFKDDLSLYELYEGSPEKTLLVHVLVSAWRDLHKKGRIRETAIIWFDEKDVGAITFSYVVEHLELGKYILDQIEEAVSGPALELDWNALRISKKIV